MSLLLCKWVSPGVLSNVASRNWIDPQSHEQPNETPTLIRSINWNGNFWQETRVLIFTKCDWLKRMIFVWDRHQGLYSLSGKTSYRKISWSLEAAKFGFKIFQSLWNLAGTSAALLPRCLSNFRAIRPLQHPISRLRDFTRFGGKTSYRLVNRGPVLHAPRLKRPPFVWDHCNRWCRVLCYRRYMIFVSPRFKIDTQWMYLLNAFGVIISSVQTTYPWITRGGESAPNRQQSGLSDGFQLLLIGGASLTSSTENSLQCHEYSWVRKNA